MIRILLMCFPLIATAQEDVLIQMERIAQKQKKAISNLERANELLQKQQANAKVVRFGNMTYTITPEDTLLGITESQTINAGILYIYANETCPSLLKSAKQEAKEWKDLYNDEVMASAFFALGYTRQLEATEATIADLRSKARKGRRRHLVTGLIVGAVGGFVIPKFVRL